MKYIFRGHIIFEYVEAERRIIEHKVNGINAYDYCRFIAEDYKLLSQFFDTAYRHIMGEDVNLKDIEVN